MQSTPWKPAVSSALAAATKAFERAPDFVAGHARAPNSVLSDGQCGVFADQIFRATHLPHGAAGRTEWLPAF